MSHVVFAWEIGSGFGHLVPIAALGKEFRRRGLRVTAVVQSGCRGLQILSSIGIDVVELQTRQAPERSFPLSVNYTANLLRNGYWHGETVARRIESWRELISRLRPDLLFCDHAPSALLASRGASLARAAMGTGFTIPPLSSPMPNIQPWFPIPAERLAEADAALLETVNPVLEQEKLTPLETAASLFDDVERFLCVEPELDHYEIRPDMAYWGTIAPSPSVQFPDTLSGGEYSVFLYMSSTNRFLRPVLNALSELGIRVLAYVAESAESEGEGPVQAPNIRYLRSWVDLREVAARCSLTITHGGTLSSSLLLMNGAKLLICPADLDKAVLGAQLQKRHLAHSLNWFAPDVENVRAVIERILDSPPLPNVASFSARHSGMPAGENVRRIVNRCEAYANLPAHTGQST